MARPTSIRIYLADGDPEGFRIVEKSNWTGQAVVVSRAQYPNVRKRSEFDKPGVYVLTAPPGEDDAKRRVYVGEAYVLRVRLDQHVKTKDFWTRLIAFTDKDLNLNKAHYKFLEARLVALAATAKSWRLENGNAPTEPSLSEPDAADAEWFLDEMLNLYPILGVDAFDVPRGTVPDADVLYLKGEAALGRGVDEPEGFLVLEGSLARVAETKSYKSSMSELRSELVADGVLVMEGDSYRFTQGYRFGSPSTAAGVLLGTNVNGREEWKTEGGASLREIQDAAVT